MPVKDGWQAVGTHSVGNRRRFDVRWERLFEDLQAQLDAVAAQELDTEVADRTRRERALLSIQQRLAAQPQGVPVVTWIAGVGRVGGSVADVGADWVLLAGPGDRRTLVPLPAVRSLTGVGGRVGPTPAVVRGFTLGMALRAVSRDRSAVTVVDIDGQRYAGTVDAVGQDALDLAEHPIDVPRRAGNVASVRVLPFAALAAVIRD
ncbi:MAG: hypothetical protein V9G08_12740 [Dermatophilaceae bacterium]